MISSLRKRPDPVNCLYAYKREKKHFSLIKKKPIKLKLLEDEILTDRFLDSKTL